MSTQIEHWLSAEGAATATPMHRYALVSAGQCEEGVVARMVAMQELACERLFMQTPEAEMADIGPWLVEIPTSSSESLRYALAHQAAAEALTLMASPLRLQKLSAHLRGFLSGTLLDGSSVLLRYFDPRIGFDMFAHWSDPVQRKFSRPLAWWAGWDGDLRIRYIKGGADTEITPSNEGVELTAEWVQAIDKAGEANLVIALLCEELETSNPPRPICSHRCIHCFAGRSHKPRWHSPVVQAWRVGTTRHTHAALPCSSTRASTPTPASSTLCRLHALR